MHNFPPLPVTGAHSSKNAEHPLVTAWFSPDTRPAQTGLYQVRQAPSCYGYYGAPDEVQWCWFDAELNAWGWGYTTRRDALAKQWRSPEGATQRRIWRGLVQPYEQVAQLLAA